MNPDTTPPPVNPLAELDSLIAPADEMTPEMDPENGQLYCWLRTGAGEMAPDAFGKATDHDGDS